MAPILVGTGTIVLSVVVSALFIAYAIQILGRYGERLAAFGPTFRLVASLTMLTLWLVLGVGIAIWMWAGLLWLLGEFNSITEALYFASVTATTLGYGDVLLSERWKLLSGFIATNGLILFSLNTAFLFEALRRLDAASER